MPRKDRLIHYNPVSQLAVYAQIDPLPDGRIHTTLWSIQEVPDDLAGQNREIGADQPNMIGHTQVHRQHIARVPDIISNQWREEDRELDDDEKEAAVKRRLNSSEFRDLRTGGGRL